MSKKVLMAMLALAGAACADASAGAGAKEGEITWRGLVPGDSLLGFTDPKAGIDEMVKHGLNLAYHFESSGTLGLTNDWARLRDIYAYARSKGVRILLIGSTAVWHRHNHPADVTYASWPCIKHSESWADVYYCWSDDRLTEDAANRYADHLVGSGAEDAIVMIHPVDTGGLEDPEHWSRRCPRCKARWKDDERWKASANQLNIWNRVLKRRCPKVSVGSCIYPYSLNLFTTPPDRRDAIWQRNFYDYWKHMDEALEDESFFLGSWIYSASVAGEIRKLVKRRPLQIHDTYPLVCGVFSTHARRAARAMDRRSGNLFCSYMNCTFPAWETYFFLGECLKDPTLPGSVPYDGRVFYNPITDHTGPDACRPVLAKICREFWGEAIAADMEDFLWSGVLPRYIEDPAPVVREWNKMLSTVDYDPVGGAAASGIRLQAKTIEDDAELMRDQAKKAEVAAAAIGRILAKLGLGPASKAADWTRAVPQVVQRDCLRSRARACRHWLAAARAQANLREFDALFQSGGRAAEKLAAARREFDADSAAAKAWGSPTRHEWHLPLETLERELEKAELTLRLAAKPDAAKAAAMKARTWSLPADPKPLCDFPATDRMTVTWTGNVVVDRPLDLTSHRLRILPGTKVTFRGEGRINLPKGALTAWGATFEAETVLTNNFFVTLDMGNLYLNGCTFRNVRTVKPSAWATRGMFAAGVRAESRVENCLFENSSPIVLMMSRRATFANNRVVGGYGGFGGIFVSGGHQMRITGNLFENVRGRAVDLQGGDDVFIADNVFVACGEGVGGYEGIGGWAPGVGNRILGNGFFGLRYPVRLRSNPFLSGTVAGNWFEGCVTLDIRNDPKRPYRAFDNVFAVASGRTAALPSIRSVPHELDPLVKAGHVQGIACSEEGIYIGHQSGVEMVGWDGKFIRRVDAPVHCGDVAYADGRLYGAFCLWNRRKSDGSSGLVRVWNSRLEQIAEKGFKVRLDGITVHNGKIYAGVVGESKLHRICRVKVLDLDLNELEDREIDFGYNVAYGVQTMSSVGDELIFGPYGGTSLVSPDLKTSRAVRLNCQQGIARVPQSVVRSELPLFITETDENGGMRNWAKDPTNCPPVVRFDFHVYENGAFRCISKK